MMTQKMPHLNSDRPGTKNRTLYKKLTDVKGSVLLKTLSETQLLRLRLKQIHVYNEQNIPKLLVPFNNLLH